MHIVHHSVVLDNKKNSYWMVLISYDNGGETFHWGKYSNVDDEQFQVNKISDSYRSFDPIISNYCNVEPELKKLCDNFVDSIMS